MVLSIVAASLVVPVRGQILFREPYTEKIESHGEVRHLPDGTPRLLDEWVKIAPLIQKYERAHPETAVLKKTSAWNFTVGQTQTWWASDMTGSTIVEYQVPSTCRAVGTHCYIFVEDDWWNSRVDQDIVDSIETAFDSKTPADPAKGIYELDTYYFGDPPDVDNDPKIIILILDVRGPYGGYFQPINEVSDASAQSINRRSNEAEIYYLDCGTVDLLTPNGRAYALLTTAHEFQHIIHHNYDKYEYVFVNEGLSETAQKLCGYELANPAFYFVSKAGQFLNWDNSNHIPDYSRAALFTWYIAEQLGTPVLKEIVKSPLTGIDGYDAASLAIGTQLRFVDLIKNFAIAVELNDTTIDPRYGFKQENLSSSPMPYRTYLDPNVSTAFDTLDSYGTRYISFVNGDSLSVTFSFNPSRVVVRAIAIGSAGKRVIDVPSTVPYVENDFGEGYDKVTFAVTNIFDAQETYQYFASGGVPVIRHMPNELAYDDGNPEGYYPWTAGDSAGVQFDAAPGAVLDSIRVAFRRAGSLSYGIWRYSGAMNPSPMSLNYGTGTIVSTDSNQYPYPVPYGNWIKSDVSGWNVDLNYPFVVGFAFGEDSTHPGLMLSTQLYTLPQRSFTYYGGYGGLSSKNQWYVVITNGISTGESVANYLVHAYIHYGTTDIARPIELAPKSFELAQNYPNPFNPETVIQYTVPVKSRVSLTVYDILGRRISTLVDGTTDPGTYSVRWDGTDGSGNSAGSGIYICRLESGTSTRTHKMVLLR